MERLFESLLDFNICIHQGFTFHPFIPKEGTICTLKSEGSDVYLFEEVYVTHPTFTVNGFFKEYWREITNELPSIEEVVQMVEETELVNI